MLENKAEKSNRVIENNHKILKQANYALLTFTKSLNAIKRTVVEWKIRPFKELKVDLNLLKCSNDWMNVSWYKSWQSLPNGCSHLLQWF